MANAMYLMNAAKSWWMLPIWFSDSLDKKISISLIIFLPIIGRTINTIKKNKPRVKYSPPLLMLYPNSKIAIHNDTKLKIKTARLMTLKPSSKFGLEKRGILRLLSLSTRRPSSVFIFAPLSKL